MSDGATPVDEPKDSSNGKGSKTGSPIRSSSILGRGAEGTPATPPTASKAACEFLITPPQKKQKQKKSRFWYQCEVRGAQWEVMVQSFKKCIYSFDCKSWATLIGIAHI